MRPFAFVTRLLFWREIAFSGPHFEFSVVHKDGNGVKLSVRLKIIRSIDDAVLAAQLCLNLVERLRQI